MNEWDFELLYSFATRPGMYLGEVTLKRIDLFLMSYELGTQYNCQIRQKLIDLLFEKYNSIEIIEGIKQNQNVSTLISQITAISNELKINWEKIFQDNLKLVIINESDKNEKNIYLKILSRKLKKVIFQSISNNEIQWHMNFVQIYKQIIEWKGENFDDAILNIIETIKIESDKMISTYSGKQYSITQNFSSNILELQSLL